MDFFQLRCFVAVATELNFSRAAVRLNMTQPPLSRQIRLLEHSIGVPLLQRTTRSVSLTRAGEAFLHEARHLLEQSEQAALSARRIAAGETGHVRISFVPGAVYGFLPEVITRSQQNNPDIRISLYEMNSSRQQEALLSRRCDLGIVRSPGWLPGICSEKLLNEDFLLAVPESHRLCQRQDLTPEDLNGEALLMYSHSAYQPFNELLSGMLRACQVSPGYTQYLESSITILSLVNAGAGIALVPRSAGNIPFRNVCFRNIALPEGTHSALFLLSGSTDDNPAAVELKEEIKQAALRAGMDIPGAYKGTE